MTRLRPPPHGETSRQPPVEEGFVARPLMAAQLAPAINDAQLEWLGVAAADRPELAGILSNAQCEQIVALRARFGDDESEEATAEMAALLSAVRALLS